MLKIFKRDYGHVDQIFQRLGLNIGNNNHARKVQRNFFECLNCHCRIVRNEFKAEKNSARRLIMRKVGKVHVKSFAVQFRNEFDKFCAQNFFNSLIAEEDDLQIF